MKYYEREQKMGLLPDRSKVVMRHLLERNAEKLPNNECVVFEDGERWNYQRALDQAYKAANSLSNLGIKRGENVLIFLPNGKDWIRAWWGVTIIGAVIIPVNTAYKGEMLRHVCNDSQADLIITNTDLGERIQRLDLGLKLIDPSILVEGISDEPKLVEPIEPWDIHMILYTSGTTGPSKGVISPYLHTYMQGIWHWTRATTHDIMLTDLPLFHAGGMIPAYALWTVGGGIAVRRVFSGSRYWDVVRETGATMSIMVGTIPAFLATTPPKPNDINNPLRLALCAPMVENPADFMTRFGIEELYCNYSMTELSAPIGTQGLIMNPKSSGKMREGVEVRLVDDHDIPVPLGEPGECIVRADLPWEMNIGYWNSPEETALAWRNGWFHTGDMLMCDEEGNYFFVDRKKDAIRRRGENISSFEVEREVMAYPFVAESACVAAPGEFGENEVKVFVVPQDMERFDPADLIKFLIPRMPYFMVPRFVEPLPELPKTHTHRIKKFELRERGNCENTWDREAAGIIVTRNT